MAEPDWDGIRQRMMALTVRQLKPIRWWFSGCLGGASTKAEVTREMASQLRHWWRLPDGLGRGRVANVLGELDAIDGKGAL